MSTVTAQPITAADIAAARVSARGAGTRVVDTLEAGLGLASAEFTRRLARTLHFGAFTMADLHALEPAFDLLSFAEALQRDCVALRDGRGLVYVAIGDPFDAALRAWAEQRIERQFEFRVAHSADIRALLSRQEESLRALDSVLGDARAAAPVRDESTTALSLAGISEDDSPVVKLVNSTIYDALKSAASDIHVETDAAGVAFKYRIDGVLTAVGSVAGADLAEQVLSRIKVLAELDIAERRVPQDGRFKVSIKGRAIDVRVSVMPSIHGEDAVLRILDRQALTDELDGLGLAHLGFEDGASARLRELARAPYGMLLVTGPTGSGKTTTLYALLGETHDPQFKTITIEDPVEYQLPGVLQIPVNEHKGLTFSRGLRSILRHDPDRILVGEIRDPETAQISVQAALTGHQVFTTLHANNAFDVIGRFRHMGVEAYTFVSALNGVVAQRLVRLVCEACAAPFQPDAALLQSSALRAEDLQGATLRMGRGCGRCRGRGYRGRRAIAEILALGDDLREAIVRGEGPRALRALAQQGGMRLLREVALDAVRAGQTTLQEVNRVTLVA
jgi:general secretion pathway protein E